MRRFPRLIIPLLVLAGLTLSLFGVAFARELEQNQPLKSQAKPAAAVAQPAGRPNEIEFSGLVTAQSAGQWVVSGRTVAISAATELKGAIQVGDRVKVHAFTAAGGLLTAREIELSLQAPQVTPAVGDDPAVTLSDDGPGHDINDDNGQDMDDDQDDDHGQDIDDDQDDDHGQDVNDDHDDDHGHDDDHSGSDDHGHHSEPGDDHGSDD